LSGVESGDDAVVEFHVAGQKSGVPLGFDALAQSVVFVAVWWV
jgi:hypothetical protein